MSCSSSLCYRSFDPGGFPQRLVHFTGDPQLVHQHPASFLATATTARFLAFLPPRTIRPGTQRRKSMSGPKRPRM